ncbi:MAG: hypothetical protein FJX53_03085 [Alphaproteobacteria bacterium]|nr:hypothetical protein [Alphaproteobacteria bacterium]
MVTGRILAFDIAINDTSGTVAFAGKARHDRHGGQGSLAIAEARLGFAPGSLQPRDLVRELADAGISNVFADLRAQGTVAWTATGLDPVDLTLALRNGAFYGPGTAGDNFSLAIRLTCLASPRTERGQRLDGRLLVGRLEPIPLAADFAIVAGPAFEVASLDLSVAGGRLAARPFRLDAGGRETALTFDVVDVDLGALLDLLGVNGLTGSGTLAGQIPMTVGPAGAAVAGGRLDARGPGTIAYDIADLPAAIGGREDIVGLVVRTLAGFRYDALSLTLDKAATGPGKLTLRLEGANEAVLDGHPFIFNITLDADFDRLAALAIEGFGTADALLDWAARGGGRGGTFPSLPQGEN